MILKEKITVKKAISIVLATIGVCVIVGTVQIDTSNQLGGISLIIAALTWSLMSVLVKRVPGQYSQIVVTSYSILVAIAFLSPFTLGRSTILGVISTACGFLLWNRGLQKLNASSGGLFFFFQPIVGTFLGWLLLDEQIGLSFWMGTAFIFIGVLLVIRDDKTHEEAKKVLTE